MKKFNVNSSAFNQPPRGLRIVKKRRGLTHIYSSPMLHRWASPVHQHLKNGQRLFAKWQAENYPDKFSDVKNGQSFVTHNPEGLPFIFTKTDALVLDADLQVSILTEYEYGELIKEISNLKQF